MIFLFSANAFYLYCSMPTIKTSDILGRASSKLTLASLELQYLSQEAQIRETEAEKLRLAKAESEQYKLQVAKDMLEHVQKKLTSRRTSEIKIQQISHQGSSGTEAIVAPSVVPALTQSDEAEDVDQSITKKMHHAVPTGSPPAAPAMN